MENKTTQQITYPHKEVWKEKLHVQLETAYAVIDKENDVELEFSVELESEEYGRFEISDTKTNGCTWYSSGGLWFTDGALTDYDGVFELPQAIVSKLESLGIDVTDFK